MIGPATSLALAEQVAATARRLGFESALKGALAKGLGTAGLQTRLHLAQVRLDATKLDPVLR
jgi:hypothetical protein